MYRVTKHYGHERGFSCCFRQWKASGHSHCSFLHGYALAFTFVFESERLNEMNWVIDFGGLKGIKSMLEGYFDHTLAIDRNDPMYRNLASLSEARLADVRVFELRMFV